MSNRLSPDFSNLDCLDGAGLTAAWQRQLGGQVPDHLPRSLLARLLAYKLQSKLHGSLSKPAKVYLRNIETDLLAGQSPETPYPDQKRLSPGIQLAREHDGILHRVMVLEDSFGWNGKKYASLSAVAKAITGTNWNGNRFFGLKDKVRSGAEASP